VSKLDDEQRDAELQLLSSRRQAEERLAEVRSAVAARVGHAPRKVSLLLVILAGAGGFALAFRGRRRGRRAGRR
jgi:hypothetical protein